MKSQIIEYNAINTAAKVTYTGGGVAVLGSLTASEITAYGGLFLAFVGLLVQIFFTLSRHKREKAEYLERKKREEEKHKLELERLSKALQNN